MEMLDKLVLPVSGDHLLLLRIMLLIAMSLFVSYSAVLLGSVISSVWYNRKANKTGDKRYAQLSRNYIDLITTAPTIWLGMGIGPLVAVILLYAQLLHGLEQSVTTYMVVSLFFYSVAVALVYIYKSAIYAKSMANSLNSSNNNEFNNYAEANEGISTSSAFWTPTFLIIALWFFVATLNISVNQEMWHSNVLSTLFNFPTLFYFVFFVVASIGFSSVVFNYINFHWEGGNKIGDEEYTSFAQETVGNRALRFLMFAPFLFAMNVAVTTINAYSSWYFVFAILTIIGILLSANFVYASLRDKVASFYKPSFWFLLFAFIVFVAKDSVSFQTVTQENTEKIAEIYLKEHAPKEEVAEVKVNAEEIYKTKCSACHKFDVKQGTAPAYNDVTPKYFDKEGEMVAFILNPKPMNPKDYPGGMPNQGLKPSEAKAMAEYIIANVKKNLGK